MYWVRNKKQINFNNLFSISVTTEKEVQELLNSAFSGIKKNNNLKDFSILTVSANKSRMVVRNYEEGSLTNVQHNIECFFNAQDMNNGKRFGIYRLAAMMYQNPTTQMKTYAITTWMEWLLFGRPLPNQVIIPLLKQIQAKGVMYPEHGAAIQSWLISQEVRGEWKLEKIKKEQPYLCGRLFAVLEELQQKATNSRERLSSRYFGSASTAPKSIFGLLIKNSQAHLNTVRKKISDRTANFYSSKIREIAGGLNDFPTVLNLKEQAEFSLGYFHQLQGVTKNKELEGEK